MQRLLSALIARTVSQTRDLSRYFDAPLVDLGTTDPRLSGIWMPKAEIGSEKIGLSEQFQANAAEYATRYSASDDSTAIFRNALEMVDWKSRPKLEVLDIGTGSGANSVVPCLRLFDACTIVATDLSSELLALLKHYLDVHKLSHRVSCVCTDSMKDPFLPGRFDVVIGSAILHHLVDPQIALATAYKALKPGGIALFIEPFEGYSVLGHTFTRMLRDERREDQPITEHTRIFLNAICIDLAARKGTDKSDIRFHYMDDKWLFTRTYIEGARKAVGFRSSVIVPYVHPNPARHYRHHAEVLLRCSGIDPESALPEWCWAYVDELDLIYSTEMKRDALLEGTIVLQK